MWLMQQRRCGRGSSALPLQPPRRLDDVDAALLCWAPARAADASGQQCGWCMLPVLFVFVLLRCVRTSPVCGERATRLFVWCWCCRREHSTVCVQQRFWCCALRKLYHYNVLQLMLQPSCGSRFSDGFDSMSHRLTRWQAVGQLRRDCCRFRCGVRSSSC
jgi:hypothetical protein